MACGQRSNNFAQFGIGTFYEIGFTEPATFDVGDRKSTNCDGTCCWFIRLFEGGVMAGRARSPKVALQTDKDALPTQALPENAPTPSFGTQEPLAVIVTKTIKSPDYRRIYANNIKMGVTQWDMTVTLGVVVTEEDGGNFIQDEVSLKLSPPFFKAAVHSLTEALRQWEATFGEIPAGAGQGGLQQGALSGMFTNLKDILEDADKVARQREETVKRR